jgi:hypothetical protein
MMKLPNCLYDANWQRVHWRQKRFQKGSIHDGALRQKDLHTDQVESRSGSHVEILICERIYVVYLLVSPVDFGMPWWRPTESYKGVNFHGPRGSMASSYRSHVNRISRRFDVLCFTGVPIATQEWFTSSSDWLAASSAYFCKAVCPCSPSDVALCDLRLLSDLRPVAIGWLLRALTFAKLCALALHPT